MAKTNCLKTNGGIFQKREGVSYIYMLYATNFDHPIF